eukprot:TRINITY_DN535_c0_g1_i2.p1 TRINITY_DN535_c0_g1~~TRINITY_DN535_c0_g1_i2.p1  ORF type:complete len:224 (-),score=19.07 TRINITY_DN535_c0_g1_i2:501-1172(-)
MNMKQISSPITGPEPLTFIPYSPPEGTHTNSSISNFNNSLNHNHVVRLSEISERISNVESTLINFIQKVDKDLSTMKSSIDQLSERCNALTNNAIRQENVSKIQQEALVQVHNYINQRVGKLFSPMPDVKPAEHESRKRKFEPDMSSLPLSKVPRSSSDGIALHVCLSLEFISSFRSITLIIQATKLHSYVPRFIHIVGSTKKDTVEIKFRIRYPCTTLLCVE